MRKALERIWWNKESQGRSLLEPVLAVCSVFYRLGMGLDQWSKSQSPQKLPRPVISVGNLTVGGTGKTPLALWLAEQAIVIGKKPCILTRGYGSESKGPRKVDPACKDWREYGDEPLLMARQLLDRGSVYVGRKRFHAGQLALANESAVDVFILDDGFQHRSLAREFDIVLIDAEREFGNGKLLPWGPLREPVGALERADAVGRVWRTGKVATLQHRENPDELNLHIGPTGWRFLGESEIHPLDELPTDQKALLLSGIGAPKGFEATVEACGLAIGGHSLFPDHHPFTAVELSKVVEKAGKSNEILVTTAKDGIRLETCGFLWTIENRPLIIEVSLIPGDGADHLKNALNRLTG